MNDILLMLDMDWATDQQITYVLDKLDKYKIKSTWFITHHTTMLDRMRKNKNIELGIHPNFHPDSTQGKGYDDIMQNLLQIVPDAVSLRTHTLFWSSRLMPLCKKYGIKNDASIILFNTPNILPHILKSYDLRRFPTYWEDDLAIVENNDFIKTDTDGLKIIIFHPVHIFLNTFEISSYKDMKEPNTTLYGINNIFDQFLVNAKKNNWCKYTLNELGEKYESKI